MATDHTTNALLTFKVGPFHLGVPAVTVDAIINMPAFRSIPLAPASVAGAFSHRDQIAIIISLRRKFGLPELADRTKGQLILGRTEAGLTAFWVDAVLDMEPFSAVTCRPMSAFKLQKTFDRFAFKEKQIYLQTDFQALYALDDAADVSDAQTTVTAAARPKNRPDKPQAVMLKVSSCTASASDEDNPRTPDNALLEQTEKPSPSPRSAPAPTPGCPAPKFENTKQRPAVKKQHFLKSSPRKRPPASRSTKHKQPFSATHHASLRPPNLVAMSYDNPVTRRRGRHRLVAVLLLLLALSVGCVLVYALRPHQATIGPSADTANQSPAKTGLLPHDKTAALDKTSADLPVIDVALSSGSRKITSNFPVTAPPRAPLPVLDPIESETPPAPSTPLAFPAAPVLKDREVMRLETVDFVLTVERPRPEDPPPSAPHPTTPINGSESVHRVVRGDTLWHIAQGYLGDPFRYPELAALSRIKDPDLIYPGDIVRIRKKTPAKP